jgi:protein tyrosine phosphatase
MAEYINMNLIFFKKNQDFIIAQSLNEMFSFFGMLYVSSNAI